MTILADPATPARPQPVEIAATIEVDSDGNRCVNTPLGVLTYLENDCLGARIDGWPKFVFEPHGEDTSEADIAATLTGIRALLDWADPTRVNRMPEQPRDVEPPATPADDEQAAGALVTVVAHSLSPYTASVLRGLADGEAGSDGRGGYAWNSDLGRAEFSEDDVEVLAELRERGLAYGAAPTVLGREVAGFLADLEMVGKAVA